MSYIIVFVAGFAVGALVFRNNASKGDAAVSWGKTMLDKLKNRAK
jgi:hypothetical protein